MKIPPIKDPPDFLKFLLTGSTSKCHHFQNNIRAYNSSLAFALLQLTGHEYAFKSRGPYCYRINGQICHLISQLQPELDAPPAFSQIYICDDEEQLSKRLKNFDGLDKELLGEL